MAQFTITTAALNWTGDRETFTFTCPDSGGAVRFSGGAMDGKQVCQNLHTLGHTLSASAATLAHVITKELTRRRRLIRRELAHRRFNALANA